MTKLEKALERFACNAEYERAHGNLQGCLEFKQLCEWLKESRAYREMYRKCYNNALNNIRAEIKALSPEPTAYDVADGNPTKEAVWEALADVLQIINKYKKGSEDKK